MLLEGNHDSLMNATMDTDSWLYVIVHRTDGSENIVGQMDTEHHIRFIPAFLDRNAAHRGALDMVKSGDRFEIQAIIFEDLTRYAVQGNSMIFLFDDKGALVSKMTPSGQPL